MKKKAFTLIELMIVVLIVGILAAVAIPILRARIDAAKWSEGKDMMEKIATAIRAYAKDQTHDNPTAIIGEGETQLGLKKEDLTGAYFVDTDFELVLVDIHSGPINFLIRCTAGGSKEAPRIPKSFLLNQDGVFDPE